MDHQKETLQTWNKIATLYEDKFMHLALYNDTYDELLESLPKTQASVLDIGCGPGNITQYLLRKRKDLKMLGIDMSENMIELARKNNPTAEFIVMDGRHISQIDKKFDAIVCGFCVPYLSERDCQKLIADCYDLLNESGVLYLSFVYGPYENSGFLTGSTGDSTFFYYHTTENMMKMLTTQQWHTDRVISKNYVKTDGTNETHVIIISRKIQVK